MDAARAYTRTARTPDGVEATLPRLSGAIGTRLKLHRRSEAIGPPAGARRFHGRWQNRRQYGDAEVTLIPFSAWGTEIHVSVSAPTGLASRILWSPARLRRIAAGFAESIAGTKAVAQTKRPEDARAQTPPRNTAA